MMSIRSNKCKLMDLEYVYENNLYYQLLASLLASIFNIPFKTFL